MLTFNQFKKKIAENLQINYKLFTFWCDSDYTERSLSYWLIEALYVANEQKNPRLKGIKSGIKSLIR